MGAIACVCVKCAVSNISLCSSTLYISELYYPTALPKLRKSINKLCTRVTNLMAEYISINLGPSIRTDCSVTILTVDFYTAFISEGTTNKFCTESQG